MEKMKMESPDLLAKNIDRIAAIFPNCITEVVDEEKSTPAKTIFKRAINFDLLILPTCSLAGIVSKNI